MRYKAARQRGDVQAMERHARQSLSRLDDLIDMQPNNTTLYRTRHGALGDLGNTLLAQGRADEAEAIALDQLQLTRQMMTLEPNFNFDYLGQYSAYVRLGRIAEIRGDLPGALQFHELAYDAIVAVHDKMTDLTVASRYASHLQSSWEKIKRLRDEIPVLDTSSRSALPADALRRPE